MIRRLSRIVLIAATAVFVGSLKSHAVRAQSIADDAFSRVIYRVSVVRREQVEYEELILNSLLRGRFKEHVRPMMDGETVVPVRYDSKNGYVAYLFPSPHLVAGVRSGAVLEKLPVNVSCFVQRIGTGSEMRDVDRHQLHCRAHSAYLGPTKRVIDVQWWHRGSEVPAPVVQARFRSIFEKLRGEPDANEVRYTRN
jgi:hypothetical protein